MKKMSLADVQSSELDMFKHFVHICEKHNLRYYLAGGTLLGAVRHGGFIPWDDDIDVLMPRPDYDKLQKLSDEVKTDRFFLASYELGNLNYPFAKIFDLDTEIYKTFDHDETEKNLWIDIFPLDGLPAEEKKVRKIFRKSLTLRKMLNVLRSQDGQAKSKLKLIFKPLLKRILTLLTGIGKIVKKIDRLARSYDFDSYDYIGGIVWGYGPQERMPKKDYIPSVKIKFEDTEASAPYCYKEYLTALYGDYMQLPPVEKRVTHDMNAWRKD